MAPTLTNNLVASFIAVVLVATSIMVAVDAVEHEIGGADGWRLQPAEEKFYSDWADKVKFKVGDTLVFKFAKGMHDVTEVSKEGYESCDVTKQLSAPMETPPVTIKLDKAGDRYFLCSVNNHCKSGMKIDIDVEPAGGDDDADSPDVDDDDHAHTHAPPTPAGASSSAPSTSPPHFPTLCLVFFSLFSAFFY